MDPTSTIHDSRLLAEKLRLAPEVSRRLLHTEKLWQYRNYSGGDPASMIDWKQSARTSVPVVREHEPLKAQSIFIWASFQDINDRLTKKSQLVLSTLSHLLTFKEREVGWILPRLLRTHLTNELMTLLLRALDEPEARIAHHPIRNSSMIFAADFSTPHDGLIDMIRNYVALNNHPLLIHLGENPAHISLKLPMLTLLEDTKTEPFIINLLIKILEDTK